VAPFRQQAKDAAWTYLKKFAAPLLAGGDAAIRESDLSVQLLGGAVVRIYGADNPDAVRGGYFDGVVLDEFADMRSSLWGEVVRPMLADRNGWATFIGTPKGKNAFWELWRDALKDPGWYTLMLRASESKILPQTELDAMAADMGPDKYAQELDCSFEAAIKGAFYANEMRVMLAEGRICPIAIDKDVRVHTAWDLGRRDSTAIWFIQCVGRERRLVDYYEASGVGLKHYADVLWQKKLEHGWQYGEHYLPHDVKVTELTTDDSRLRTLERLGVTDIYVVPRHNDLDGINAVRKMLGRTWIDSARCERGIEALRQYRRDWDDARKDFRDSPRHDWSSHGCDALRYFAVGFDDPAGVKSQPDRPRQERPSGATHWSY
jgi:hypothetical protein